MKRISPLGGKAWYHGLSLIHISQTFDKIRRKLEGIPFDFLIGSCHHIEGPDFHRPPAWRSGVTRQEVCERYIRALMDCIQAYDGFDVLGHITYYSRYNPCLLYTSRCV